MKKYLYLLILLLYLSNGYGKEYVNPKDSMIAELATLPHDTLKLRLISRIASFVQGNQDDFLYYSDMLLKEASLQKNDDYLCDAIYYHVVFYYNQNDSANLRIWFEKLKPIALQLKKYDTYFDGLYFQIELQSMNEEFEEAIDEAKQMLEEAKEFKNINGIINANQCLASAYLATGRMEKAALALEEAYSLLTPSDDLIKWETVLVQIIFTYREMGDNENCFKYLQVLEEVLEKKEELSPGTSANDNTALFMEVGYAYYYLQCQKPELAWPHLERAKDYYTEHTYFMYKLIYHEVLGEYYRYIKEYDKAIAEIDSALNPLFLNFSANYLVMQTKKADVLYEKGDIDKALKLYKQIQPEKDSINNMSLNTQMERIRSNYMADKISLERERKKNTIQMIILYVIIVVFIVLLLFIYRINRIRKQTVISEQARSKAANMAKEANEVKSRFLQNLGDNIRIPLNRVVEASRYVTEEQQLERWEKKAHSDIIEKNSKWLLKLVNDVLELSRLEVGMTRFNISDCDVVDLCNDAIGIVRADESNHSEIIFENKVGNQTIITDISRLIETLVSILTSTVPVKIHFLLEKDCEQKVLRFTFAGSAMADMSLTDQSALIRRDINRLLIEHFGGTCELVADPDGNSKLIFTYPYEKEC